MRHHLLPMFFVIGVIGTAAGARGESPDYLSEIKPLLLTKCVSCHGPLRQEAGLRLDTASLLIRGADSGPVVVASAPEESYLLDRVTTESVDERMPPANEGSAVTDEEVAMLRHWIAAGLPAPEDEKPLPPPQEHWAYQPIRRPEIPELPANSSAPVQDVGISAIDHFLAVAQQRAGVVPADRADPATLLRRITLDLTGLPPRRAELNRFLENDPPHAYARVVDRLLDSPQYGERWGRHWMDVWRYSDWDGYKEEVRGSQRHIWHWRDWIIQSLNEDKGYDRMIMEMIAGDELAPLDPKTLRATGFLVRNFHHSNRDIWLDATVEHTAKAFLGMTIACARCHDHKYDPISQREYYGFRAIFEPHRVRTDRLPGEPDLARDGLPRVYDADLDVATYLYLQGNERRPDKENPVAPTVPAIFGRPLQIEPVALPLQAYFPAAAEHVQREDLESADRKVATAEKALQEYLDRPTDASHELELPRLTLAAAEAERQSLSLRWAAARAKHSDAPAAEQKETAARAAAAERQTKLRQAELQVALKQQAADRAASPEAASPEGAKPKAAGADSKDADKQRDAIAKANEALEAARKALVAAQAAAAKEDSSYTPVGEAYPRTSSGRRLALARWIATAENPLTARVAVNHVWMRHFGEPLVEKVSDFGLQSARPVHADLLDWLAAELIDSGWSLKHLHRQIVLSEAYAAASHGGNSVAFQRSAAIDPDNLLFWRANARRLDAEVIRDSLFFVGGSLDLTLGGAQIPFTQGETVPRRSIYFHHAYEKQMVMLTLFDAASPNECYRRSASIVPQQALALSNSAASLTQARKLAGTLWAEASGSHETNEADAVFIQAAFQQVLSRSPRAEEMEICRGFLDQQQRLLADPSTMTASAGKATPEVEPAANPAMRARENLVHVLFSHNDFVTVR